MDEQKFLNSDELNNIKKSIITYNNFIKKKNYENALLIAKNLV